MKMKYTAAIALLAWLAVVGWLSSMVIAKPAVLYMGNQAEESPAMADLRNGIARNRQTMEGIASLRGATPYLGPSKLIALPAPAPVLPLNPDGSVAGNAAIGSALPGAGATAVTLVMVTDGRRSAVVNGEVVRTGSRLANGARVTAIGNDWVRVAEPSGSAQTYRVRDPLAPGTGGSPR